MESLFELLMVKHQKRVEGSMNPADLESVLTKLSGWYLTKGFSKQFVDSYLRYDSTTHFFVSVELGLPISILLQDVRDITLDFVRRMKELCQLFGCEMTEKVEAHEYMKYYLLVLFDQVHSSIKLQTNFIFTRFYGLESPEGIYVPDFLPRPLKRIIARMGEGNPNSIRRIRNQSLIYTIFQGWKKGLYGGFPSMVAKSLKKHELALTKVETIPAWLEHRLDDLLVQMSEELRLDCNPDNLLDLFQVGDRATIESSFSDGGELGYAHREAQKKFPSSETNLGYVRPIINTTNAPTWEQNILKEDLDPTPITGVGPISSLGDIWSALNSGIEEDVLHWRYRDLSGERRPLRVSPACIIEPLKVRIITKPEIGTFTKLRYFQKKLWRYLSNHPSGCFSLTGKSLDRSDLWDLVLDWQPGDKFCSGDYSAATDNLKRCISEKIIKHLFGRIFFSDHSSFLLAMESMVDNDVVYSESAFPNDLLYHAECKANAKRNYAKKVMGFESSFSKENPHIYHQTNGQLMGNVLSFPILCIANYLSYHISQELSCKQTLDLWDVPPVLINGDDILFKCKDKFYKIWLQVIKQFGFEASLGKNLLSDRILQINSELYYVVTSDPNHDANWKCVNLIRIPFLNFGLVTFRGKQDCSRDLRQLNNRDYTVQTMVSDWDQWEEQNIGRAMCASEIYDSAKECSGFLWKQGGESIFLAHFKFLQTLFPGLTVGTPDSASLNKCLFKGSGGVKLPPSLLEEISKNYPSLRLEKTRWRYFRSSRDIHRRFCNPSLRNHLLTLAENRLHRVRRKFRKYNNFRRSVNMDPIEFIKDLPDLGMELELV